MSSIKFQKPEGSIEEAPFKPGWSVMEAAARLGVDGILAECGGACACSTCHVMLSDEDYARFGEPSEMEDALLDLVATGRRATSRLSCQLTLTATDDGLVVQLPYTQV